MGNINTLFVVISVPYYDASAPTTVSNCVDGVSTIVDQTYFRPLLEPVDIKVTGLCFRETPALMVRYDCDVQGSTPNLPCVRTLWDIQYGCSPPKTATTTVTTISNSCLNKVEFVHYNDLVTILVFDDTNCLSSKPFGVSLQVDRCYALTSITGIKSYSLARVGDTVIQTYFQDGRCTPFFQVSNPGPETYVYGGCTKGNLSGSFSFRPFLTMNEKGDAVPFDDRFCKDYCLNIVKIVASCVGGLCLLCCVLNWIRSYYRAQRKLGTTQSAQSSFSAASRHQVEGPKTTSQVPNLPPQNPQLLQNEVLAAHQIPPSPLYQQEVIAASHRPTRNTPSFATKPAIVSHESSLSDPASPTHSQSMDSSWGTQTRHTSPPIPPNKPPPNLKFVSVRAQHENIKHNSNNPFDYNDAEDIL